MGQVLRAEELQHLVHLRLAGNAGAGHADPDRDLPDDALQARCGARLRIGRVHHARRALGLARPLHALDGRLGVLHRRLPAHVPRADLRQLPQAARADLDLRLRHLPVPDGRGVHGLPAAMGPDELLGCASDRQPVRGGSLRRTGPRAADPRRLRRRRRHPEPLLQLPRDRGPARPARSRGRSPDCAARGRLEQPGRHRHQEEPRFRRASARRHPLASLLHDARHVRRLRLPVHLQRGGVLRAGGGRLLPRVQQLHRGESAEDAGAHRAGLVLHAVLFDAAGDDRPHGQRAGGDPRRSRGARASFAATSARPGRSCLPSAPSSRWRC